MTQILDGEIYGKEIIDGIHTVGHLPLGTGFCDKGIVNGEMYKPELIDGDFVQCVIYNRTSDAYWENDLNFTWTDPIWVPGVSESEGTLGVTGTWAVGFRPSWLRVTSNDPVFELSPRNTNDANILLNDDGGDYAGTWLELAFLGFDLDKISFDGIEAMTAITKIEFKL